MHQLVKQFYIIIQETPPIQLNDNIESIYLLKPGLISRGTRGNDVQLLQAAGAHGNSVPIVKCRRTHENRAVKRPRLFAPFFSS